MPIPLTDPRDPRVEDYFGLTDVNLRRKLEPERGLYMAESDKVIRRALAAGHRPRSLLLTPRWVTGTEAAAGTDTAEVTPGTTEHSSPAAAHACSSSKPRPNTYGSPPLSRTTCFPARP